MSDTRLGNITEQLAARLDALEQENLSLREQMAAMRATQAAHVAQVAMEAPPLAVGAPVQQTQPAGSGDRTSRRGLLRVALGVTAATAGTATIFAARTSTASASGTEGPTVFVSTLSSVPAVQAYALHGGRAIVATSAASDAVNVMTSGDGTHAALRATATGGAPGSAGANGINAASDHGYGVYGTTIDSTGVFGGSTSTAGNGVGVEGFSTSGTGVVGQGGAFTTPTLPSNTGVYGHGTSGNGVYAVSDSSDAIYGTAANGRGGVFAGTAAAVNLAPASANTHPTGGNTGDLFVDSTGALWYCKAGGSAATWVKLA